MADKIYKKLPGVLQTTAIKNFFESTVEQLFSKANVDNVQGYIGSPTSSDVGASSKFLSEPTATKRSYALSPVINTINISSGDSENMMFYDELIDTLRVYGVDTKNQNKIFSEGYATYTPPIDADKLLNYQEYYWATEGPTVIDITGTLTNPIDIDTDIIGKANYTPNGGKKFRNGMLVEFSGTFVIPQNKVSRKYIVSGVGESIKLLDWFSDYNTPYFTSLKALYDVDIDVNAKTDAKVLLDSNTNKFTFGGGSLNFAHRGSWAVDTVYESGDVILDGTTYYITQTDHTSAPDVADKFKDNGMVIATEIEQDIEYTILTAGTTDFTLIGAADNNIGTTFTATGKGNGDGTATSSHHQQIAFIEHVSTAPKDYILQERGAKK